MKRYIGLDVHAASTTFAVISEAGNRVGSHVVETNGQALVAQFKTIPGEKHVVLEEGTQSAWIYEILKPHATEVVVAMVSQSRGQKSDERDAFGLADRLRTGGLEGRVFKEAGEFRTLRELGRTHQMVVQDSTRVQNRIKALLRSRGIAVSGKAVYSKTGREEYLERLPDASRGAAKTLYAQYDAVEEIRRQAEKDLVKGSASPCDQPVARDVSRTWSDPRGADDADRGVADAVPNQATVLVVLRSGDRDALVVGLGRNKDGGWARAEVKKTRGLNLNHNHTLKYVFKGAATTVIAQHETDPLHQDYERLISAGTKPNLAKVTLARKIAAIALSMWKSKEKYDPTKHRKQK
jgi:hypothetical protein